MTRLARVRAYDGTVSSETTGGPQLLIMAAGLGSRFGGVKQLARVGANGEAFLDFSIKQALAAGFGSVVLIVRSEIKDDVYEHIAEQHPHLDVTYVCQDDLGPERAKPWGTTHAVLSAQSAVHSPFAVINADDYYGPTTFAVAAEELAQSEAGRGANVAFELGRTVPPRGSVTRAVVQIEGEYFSGLVETDGCERLEDGTLVAGAETVPEDTPVSMNFWCFDPTVLAQFGAEWRAFLAAHGDEPKSECGLPTTVNDLIGRGELKLAVARSSENWIGITNPEDLELARKALQ